MFRYYYCITTADKIDNLYEYEDEIKQKVIEFNKYSNVARTYKNIVLDTLIIKNDRMEFEMETKDNLGSNLSLRPLHLLSQLLLEISGLNEKCINKRFLKPIIIKSLQEENIDELTDVEVIKTVIEVYMSKKNTKEIIGFKDRVRDLVKEYLFSWKF